jgi:exodeoxyribonuclease VII large subunit
MQRRLAQLHPGVELRQRAQRLDELELRLARVVKQQLRHRHALVAQHAAHLRHASPVVRIADAKTRMKIARAAINAALRGRLQQLRRQLAVAGGKLDTISPLATLNRGYAIVTDAGGHVVTDAGALRPGDLIEARVAVGRLSARVERSLRPPEGTE